MKKGIGYLYFLIIFSVVLIIILGVNTILLDQRREIGADLDSLQAQSFADSAIIYYRTKPVLTDNKLSGLTLDKLLSAMGLEYKTGKGGFKIIENKGKIYFLGFTGKNLNEYKALKVLVKEGTNFQPWFE